MFDKCHKCVGGLKCRDDYAFLKSGYYWEWRKKTLRSLQEFHCESRVTSTSIGCFQCSVLFFDTNALIKGLQERSLAKAAWIPPVKMASKVHSVTFVAQDTITS